MVRSLNGRLRTSLLLSLCLLSWILTSCSSTDESKGDTPAQNLFEKAQEEARDENYHQAIEIYNELKTKYPYSKFAKDAELGVADSYFKQESFPEAAAAYQAFIQLYPKDNRVAYALFQQGLSFANQTPDVVSRDLTKANEAIDLFDRVISKHQDSEFVAKAREQKNTMLRKLAEKEEYIGNFYFIRDIYLSAALRYERIVKEFPGLGLDEIALYRAGVSLARVSQKEKAKAYFEQLVQKYPNHPLAEKARDEIKQL